MTYLLFNIHYQREKIGAMISIIQAVCPHFIFFTSYLFIYLFIYWLHPWHAEVPGPRIEPMPHQWQCPIHNHWATRELPHIIFVYLTDINYPNFLYSSFFNIKTYLFYVFSLIKHPCVCDTTGHFGYIYWATTATTFLWFIPKLLVSLDLSVCSACLHDPCFSNSTSVVIWRTSSFPVVCSLDRMVSPGVLPPWNRWPCDLSQVNQTILPWNLSFKRHYSVAKMGVDSLRWLLGGEHPLVSYALIPGCSGFCPV